MIEAKTRLEFDKILERIAHHASFSMGKDRVLNSEPFSTLIVNRELKRLKAAMLLLGNKAFNFLEELVMFHFRLIEVIRVPFNGGRIGGCWAVY